MAKGDHIYYYFQPGLTHHGIDCGDGKVIHYEGSINSGSRRITRIPKSEFGRGHTIHIRHYDSCDSPSVVVQRAESRLSENAYQLLSNNCEHFACWCKTGRETSQQVRNAKYIGQSAVNAGGAVIRNQVAARAARQALNPVAKGLVKVGLKQAPKAAGRAVSGIASGAGVVSGIATDIALDHMYKDDESLSSEEREARKAARKAGSIASTVGGLGAVAAAAAMGTTAAAVGVVAAPAVLGFGAAVGVHHHLSKQNKKKK